MQTQQTICGFSRSVPPLLLLLLLCSTTASGFGLMGPISASFCKDGFFCFIDASGKQDVVCWGKNSSSSTLSSASSSSSASFGNIPAMAALSGGEDFLCGVLANTSLAYCWSSVSPGIDAPPVFKSTAYSHIAAGKSHVCAIRGSYYSDHEFGTAITNLVFKTVVSGEGFSCGGVRDGGLICWGPNSSNLGISGSLQNFTALASGRAQSVEFQILYVSLAAGDHHFCGIRHDNHRVECWGMLNSSLIPKTSGFLAIASSDYTTCGIREDDLVIDCWDANATSSPPEYDPPLELCSPGLCTRGSCGQGEFSFNASILNEVDLTSLCVRKDLTICSSCGSNCSEGFFLSSSCSEHADRVCTAFSLCQNSSCWDICGLQTPPEMRKKLWNHVRRLVIIFGSSALGFLLILTCWCLLPHLTTS
ncbi:hypothetical protein ACFX10_032357 [Malus domestica]